MTPKQLLQHRVNKSMIACAGINSALHYLTGAAHDKAKQALDLMNEAYNEASADLAAFRGCWRADCEEEAAGDIYLCARHLVEFNEWLRSLDDEESAEYDWEDDI